MKNNHHLVSNALDSLSARRADRQHRQELARELAAFASPADRLELDLIAGRYSEQDSREVREVLARQAVRAA